MRRLRNAQNKDKKNNTKGRVAAVEELKAASLLALKDIDKDIGNNENRLRSFYSVISSLRGWQDWKVVNCDKLSQVNTTRVVDVGGKNYPVLFKANFPVSKDHQILAIDTKIQDFSSNPNSNMQNDVPTYKACIKVEGDNWMFEDKGCAAVISSILYNRPGFNCWFKKAISASVQYMKDVGKLKESQIETLFGGAIEDANNYLTYARTKMATTKTIAFRWDIQYLMREWFVPESAYTKNAKHISLRRATVVASLLGMRLATERDQEQSANQVGVMLNTLMNSGNIDTDKSKEAMLMKLAMRDGKYATTVDEKTTRMGMIFMGELFGHVKRTVSQIVYDPTQSAGKGKRAYRSREDMERVAKNNEFIAQTWVSIEGRALRTYGLSTDGAILIPGKEFIRNCYSHVRSFMSVQLSGVPQDVANAVFPLYDENVLFYSNERVKFTGSIISPAARDYIKMSNPTVSGFFDNLMTKISSGGVGTTTQTTAGAI